MINHRKITEENFINVGDVKMTKEIFIEEIPVSNIDDFWKIHIKYLVDDDIISDEEDIDYFSGEEYRGIIKEHMERA